MFATSLRGRQCGAETELGATYYCDACFGPLEVAYDYVAVADSPRPQPDSGLGGIWRYQSLLPVEREPVDIGTGWTPLIKADRLGKALGLCDLWIKNDSV